jgi:hypothetical protein
MSETRAFLAAVNIHILEFDAALVLTSASRSVRDEQFLRYSAGCSV